MGRLILIRHGETDKNLEKSLHSVNDAQALNVTGIEQIEGTVDRLKELSPAKIYSSTEKRAVESARILARRLGIPMEKIDGIQERNFGIFTGESWGDVKNILAPMTLEERYEYVPKDGESWRAFETRLIAAIKKIVEENKDKTIGVVTHGGAIKALMPFLRKAPKEESYKDIPGNASLTIFDFDDKGFHQVAINDDSHLTGK